MKQDEKVITLFHEFLQLTNLEKLAMVEAINEYFDSNDKESIRAENEERFKEIRKGSKV